MRSLILSQCRDLRIGVTREDFGALLQLHKHYIYPLMPSPAHLLPLTESDSRAIHRELGFNRWKKIPNPSVSVNSQPWTARCGDHYDPQAVKRSKE